VARLTGIYLNDHLAGSTLGVELARRALAENDGNEYGAFLRDLEREIAEDRRTLIAIMQQLGVTPSKAKYAYAWAAEKAGRLKLNGRLRGYSPLSRLVELEGLASGIEGKLALWLALQHKDDARLAEFDLHALAERARSQRERLEPFRLAAAAAALD
jgi:hypothetical protein